MPILGNGTRMRPAARLHTPDLHPGLCGTCRGSGLSPAQAECAFCHGTGALA